MTTQESLGSLIPSIADAERDAIHIAVAPVVAGQVLRPGDRISFVSGSQTHVERSVSPIGIVDPFLPASPIPMGCAVWMFLLPNTITSLKHVWEHPAFTLRTSAHPAPQGSDEAWLRNYAASFPLRYETLMEGAASYIQHGDYLCFGGLLEGEATSEEFWEHYDRVTGRDTSVPLGRRRGNFFSCSC